jgi:serpin B
LPKKKEGLAAFEKTLTPAWLQEFLGQLHRQEVQVSIPKFNLTAKFELEKVLPEMGMPLAFDDHKADFSGISESKDPLYISAVAHKAFVDVNEEGSEAAASTAVVVSKAPAPPPRRAIFRADHPFVFLIRDGRTGLILFLGRVQNPVA